ncbi:hypothetical protein BV25DRAFT_486151 [Artomyces pyxidatus]|uniref:Uncharacterized protein n=1 Tax=Artomyces pyxidatus TaxID=48021 RepID=A0ACB8T2I2_9AGAM|nr:hypothetical protein BV25DRAFT_486151 [Artomyces pyxidatus]
MAGGLHNVRLTRPLYILAPPCSNVSADHDFVAPATLPTLGLQHTPCLHDSIPRRVPESLPIPIHRFKCGRALLLAPAYHTTTCLAAHPMGPRLLATIALSIGARVASARDRWWRGGARARYANLACTAMRCPLSCYFSSRIT